MSDEGNGDLSISPLTVTGRGNKLRYRLFVASPALVSESPADLAVICQPQTDKVKSF